MPFSGVCSLLSIGVVAAVGDAGDMVPPSRAHVSADKGMVVPGAPPAVNVP